MIAEWTRRNLIWLLLAVYALAALAPGPGVLISGVRFVDLVPSRVLPAAMRPDLDIGGPAMLLVAVLLFCAAVQVDPARLRTALQRPVALATALALVWIGPGLVVLLAGYAAPAVLSGPDAAGLLLGLALVAAMPVANSSAGWAQQSGGDLAWSVALVVLSLLVGAWFTPPLLRLMGMSLSATQEGAVETLVRHFSGWAFLVWVLAPTLLGLAVRRLLGAKVIAHSRTIFSVASAASLLALNYINAARVLPQFFAEPKAGVIAAAVVMSIAICGVGVLSAALAAWVFKLPRETRLALAFGLSMKHTGLAHALAAQTPGDQPLAILLIVVATLTQHVGAALLSRRR